METKQNFSRKDFLKLSWLAMGGIVINPMRLVKMKSPRDSIGIVRVTVDEIRIFSEPSYSSKVISKRKRDQLIYVFRRFESSLGPSFNPNWYALEEGYAHSAYLQPVETHLNKIANHLQLNGQVFETTVPITQSYLYSKTYGWEKLYRLYFQSTHWVTGIREGPDGAPWYKLNDDLNYIDYYVLATHLRPIPESELTPLAVHIPQDKKRVEVSLEEQRLWAYQGDNLVLDTKVSTGIPSLSSANGIPTATPRGNFNISSKMPVRHMGNGQVTSDLNAYELPGVPWVSFFTETGVAFHGTYWHDNFGNEMSHGCVNMRPTEAKWLFRWLSPTSKIRSRNTNGFGTRVIIY